VAGYTQKHESILAGVIAFVLNAVLAPVILVFWPGFGMAMALLISGRWQSPRGSTSVRRHSGVCAEKTVFEDD
jgi:hypothetical protein